MILFRSILCALMLLPCVAMAESDAMLKKAERSRRDAEEKLGHDRLSRSNERVEWTQKVQTAHAKLAQAETKLKHVNDAKRGLQKAQAQMEKNKALTDRRIAALNYAIRRAAGYPSASTAIENLDAFNTTMTAGTWARLQSMRSASKLSVGQEEVIDRSGQLRKVKIVRLGTARALALGGTDASRGLLRKTEQQQWLVDGAKLNPSHAEMINGLASGQATHVPLDVDGSLARSNFAETSTSQWLEQGGIFVWPIIIVGLLGLFLMMERIFYLFGRKVRASRIGAVKRAIEARDFERAVKLITPTRCDLDRILLTGVQTIDQPLPARENAFEEALLAEEPRLERSLTLLAAAAGVAPLLGLLGTVTGMIGTFDVIAQHGTGNPRLLSGGISVALITTQLGLMVAVPLLLGHAWVSRAVEKRQALLEECRSALLGLCAKEEVSK